MYYPHLILSGKYSHFHFQVKGLEKLNKLPNVTQLPESGFEHM